MPATSIVTTSAATLQFEWDPDPEPCLQRSHGLVRLGMRAENGPTRLAVLHQAGCGKLRLPNVAGAPEAILINMAGGLTGGDRFATEIEVGPGAALTLTTQACEKIYRSVGDDAVVSTKLRIGEGASCAWLPQETILFDGARLERSLEADLADGARLLATEAVVFGRQAMGETVTAGALHDRWRIRRGGRLLFADDVRLQGDLAAILARPAVAGGARGLATILLVADDAEDRLGPVRDVLPGSAGASAWDGRLVVRLLAESHRALRDAIVPILTTLRDGASLPRVWSV